MKVSQKMVWFSRTVRLLSRSLHGTTETGLRNTDEQEDKLFKRVRSRPMEDEHEILFLPLVEEDLPKDPLVVGSRV